MSKNDASGEIAAICAAFIILGVIISCALTPNMVETFPKHLNVYLEGADKLETKVDCLKEEAVVTFNIPELKYTVKGGYPVTCLYGEGVSLEKIDASHYKFLEIYEHEKLKIKLFGD